MTALTQTISDVKAILYNDKRVWACLGFVFFALLIWLSTTTWREPKAPFPDEYVNVPIEQEKIQVMIKSFNQDMLEGKEEREYLQNYLSRFTNELEVGKKDMDWQVNILMNKLDDMSEKVDGLIHKVGEGTVKKAILNKKLKSRKGSKRKNVKVDRSML